jgi:hypothetical protein
MLRLCVVVVGKCMRRTHFRLERRGSRAGMGGCLKLEGEKVKGRTRRCRQNSGLAGGGGGSVSEREAELAVGRTAMWRKGLGSGYSWRKRRIKGERGRVFIWLWG